MSVLSTDPARGRGNRAPAGVPGLVLACLALACLLLACNASPGAEHKLRIWKDESSGLEFVWIEPGCFSMGQTQAERRLLDAQFPAWYVTRLFDDEPPARELCLEQGFWMSRTEVTQKAWRAIMAGKRDFCTPGEDKPVDFVTWFEAVEYAKRLSEAHEGRQLFRLPTEAEWEYACRAGTSTAFSTGDTIGPDQANYHAGYAFHDGRTGPFRNAPTPAGSFPPNAFGLFDMHGNVEEWVGDIYVSPESSRDPVPFRVARGGRWTDHPQHLRCAARRGYTPFYVNCALGFRLVRVPASPEQNLQ